MDDSNQFDEAMNTSPSEQAPTSSESSQVVPMVLITLPQRAALIDYLAKQPYADVANGIEFLKGAPQINVTITAPDPSGDSEDGQP
jgi:hypothetical protein